MIVMPTAVALSFKRGPWSSPVQAWLNSSDEQMTIDVYRVRTGDVVSMPLGDYLIDVLAAELPPGAPPQALAAAAVAARTYAVQAMLANRLGQYPTGAGPANALSIPSAGTNGAPAAHGGSTGPSRPSGQTAPSSQTKKSSQPGHKASNTQPPLRNAALKGADVTDSGQWDLPLLTAAAQDARWGSQVDAVRAKYQAAILATDGLIVTYHSRPILAFAFQLSPGVTRSAAQVFDQSIPYLQAVACPDDEKVAQQPLQTYSPAQLAARLGIPAKSVNVNQFTVSTRTSDGFVVGVKGPQGGSWSGSAFAKALSLPSADFTLKASQGTLTVESFGIGQDVGLSLHEATVLAARGETWQHILARFYPGTAITPDVNFNLGSTS